MSATIPTVTARAARVPRPREPRDDGRRRRQRGLLNARGLTLLETMVALVILGLVVVGYLEVFAGTARAQRNAETWTRALAYAEGGMELVKLDPAGAIARGPEELDDGFRREITGRPVRSGLVRVTVTVLFPDRGRFDLDRLVELP